MTDGLTGGREIEKRRIWYEITTIKNTHIIIFFRSKDTFLKSKRDRLSLRFLQLLLGERSLSIPYSCNLINFTSKYPDGGCLILSYKSPFQILYRKTM